MKLNLPTSACDRDRLESFLSGQLSVVQERDFLAHLDTCEHCRRALQQLAAEPEAWIEAEQLLKSSPFDSHGAEDDSDGTTGSSTRQPPQIQAVLDTLGPTDDPQMLGRVGGYEVAGVVGAGGMGVVLRAIDRSLDRTVAIKVMAPHLATRGAARKRFAREAKAAAAVLHPNVIAIHSVSNDEALPYLVMPYVRGTSLQKRLAGEGPLSVQEILRIGSQIAAGLAAAHAQGLVHRDISPANILLEDGVERVTITDFGLARAVDDAAITTSGVLAGTPQYMSPEQARGEAVDGRSDLFSLGSVLYAIAAGRPPFRAETTHGVLRRITDDEPAPIREINPDIPAWLCTIIVRLMSKRPDSRYQSAAEVAELLEQCLAHVQQPAAVPLPAAVVATKSRRPWNLSLQRIGAIAMFAVFAIGVLGLALWQASEPPDIAGKWTGPEWGDVTLHQKAPGEYEGTYTDTFKKMPGSIQLKWSRLEGRYKGTWREGEQRSGKLVVRLVEDQIRGAWTTDKESLIDPGTPELADLLWKRSGAKGPELPAAQPLGIKIDAGPQKSATGKPMRFGHFTTGHGIKIACSADGKLIAIANGNPTRILQTNGTSRVKGDWKPTAEVFEIETGKLVVALKLTTDEEQAVLAATERISHIEVAALAFAPAGDAVTVGTNIGQVKLFHARTGELLRTLDDEQARLADKDTPDNWKPLKRALGSVSGLAFSPDGSLLATCGTTFREFSNTFDGIERLTREVTGPGRLKVWDLKTGALKDDLAGHSHATGVAFSADGNLLASAGRWSSEGDNGTGVIIWNSQTGAKISMIATEANAGTHTVAFSPTNKLVVFGSQRYDKENDTYTTAVSVTYAFSGITEWQRQFPGWAYPKAFSPDGKSLLVLSSGQSIQFVDTQTGTTKREIKAANSPEGGPWVDFALTAEGRRLAIAAVSEEEGSIVLWDLENPSSVPK